MIKSITAFIQKNKLLCLVAALGSALSLLIILPSGSHYCYQSLCGIFFWGAHEMDAVWHISLIHNAFRTIPFINPIYSGASLSGYNLLLDLFLSLFTRLGLTADILYFKILPLVWVLLFVFLLIRISRVLKKDYVYTVALLFFSFFGSTFMYLLDVYHGFGYFGLDSFGSALNLTNIQFSISLLVLLALMYVLRTMKNSPKKDLIVGILMFINTGLKFYAGFITGVFILTYYVANYVKDRDLKKLVQSTAIFGVCAVISIFIIYDPLTSLQLNEPILSLKPLALSRVMIEEPSKVYLPNMVLARYTLLQNGIGPRLIAIEAFSVLLFIVFNFGTRLICWWTITYKIVKRKLSELDISIITSMIAGILMVLLFVQRGQWWNTVQFFYYSLFLSSFFAAEFMSDVMKKKSLIRGLVAVIIILLTLPYNIGIVINYSRLSKASSFISDDEIAALQYLKSQPYGIVASTKPQRAKPQDFAHSYQKDTAYISAYSQKPAYYESEVFLQLLGIDYLQRKNNILIMNPSIYKDVDYVYVHNVVGLAKLHPALERIFHNQEITLYKVHHELIQ